MPRYYLDLHEDLDLYSDADGADFDGDEAARIGALQRMGAMLRGLSDLGPETKLLIVTVRRSGEREPFAAVSTRVTTLR